MVTKNKGPAEAGGASAELRKCSRAEIKRYRCDYDLVKVYMECSRHDQKIRDYMIYLIATTDYCDRRRAPYILSSLLMLGANPNATYRRRPVFKMVLDNIGGGSLEQVIYGMRIAILFVSHGVDVNTRDRRGNTLLHYATQYSWALGEWIVADLLQLGADPNIRNKNGETPLHVAVRSGGDVVGRIKVIKTLLEHGADPHIRDKNGKTPLDYATDDVAEVLRAKVETASLKR